MPVSLKDCEAAFDEINSKCFDNELKRPLIELSDGEKNCYYSQFDEKHKVGDEVIPVICVWDKLDPDMLKRTMLHEMTHYYIWQTGGSLGHTKDFWEMSESKYHHLMGTE